MRTLLAALSCLLVLGPLGQAHGKETITLAFFGADGDAWLGFRQAVDEANRQGRFLGFDFQYEIVEDVDDGIPDGTQAVFTALPGAAVQALAERFRTIPVFNLAARDEALRRACHANVFHASATPRMLKDALDQWRRAGNAVDGVDAKVWNNQFRRYAAIQLSDRFAEAHGVPMSDLAYAGWAGTRLYAQVVMARGSASAAAMVTALHADDVSFDGQKGVPMRFRPSGQLDQMLLLEQDGKVVGTAPVRGVHAAHELRTLGFNGCKETNTP